MYHREVKEKAIKLRKEGYSYNYIIKQIPVRKSTLSDWLHDIPFKPNKHTIETIGNARIASGKYKHQLRVDSLFKAKIQAEKDISSLSNRDIMMLGLGLYIGEGGKTGGVTRMINSDPKIITFIIKWWRTCFEIEEEQLMVRLHIYPDTDEKMAIEYWSKNTRLPIKQFYKSTVDRRTNKRKFNHGKLPFGTAHVTVIRMGNKKHGVYLHRRIMAWIDRVMC